LITEADIALGGMVGETRVAILLAFVFGVLLLGWLVAVLVILVSVMATTVSTVERISDRPDKFLATDAQFLRNIGIRL
jgi:hypothetical protein